MRSVPFHYVRQHLKTVLDELAVSREPVRIKGEKGRAAILVDAEDFDSLMETACLLRSPANAARLKQALDEFESGKGNV